MLSASSAEIGVVAKDGTVTLYGQLSSHAKKMAAERAAKRVKGVKIVAMEIIVVVPGKSSRTTTGIVRAVRQALNWHMALENAIIEAKVEDEWVYLEGDKREILPEKGYPRPKGGKTLRYIWKGPAGNKIKKKTTHGLRMRFPVTLNPERLKK